MFWILVAALIGMALAFILPPLLRPAPLDSAPAQDALNLEVFQQRLCELEADLSTGFLDQDQYAAARRDLERELLHDLADAPGAPSAQLSAAQTHSSAGRWLALALSVAIPALAVALYWQLGNLNVINQLQTAATTPAPAPAQDAPALADLVARLEARLKKDASNVEGWLMLGRTQFALDARQQGLAAVTKAYELAPTQTEVMLAYAEALAAASDDRSLAGRPTELVDAVLAREPTNPTARWLRGMTSYQQGDFVTAVATWQAILAELEPGGEEANNLQLMIDEATRRGAVTAPAPVLNTSPAAIQLDSQAVRDAPLQTAEPAVLTAEAAVETASAAPAPVAMNAAIAVTVALDPALAAQTTPDQAVFIFARAAHGAPMPLAAVRLLVKELPQTVTLDDSAAVSPALRLSTATEVIVGARISASGEAMPHAGDLEGETAPLPLRTTEAVTVTIDRVRQ
ncbi:c-type cytochrome biogenesis protein CcmI [Chromatium okenii]|uniref:c-type cytochrome biogenesis protein CcmI n=1 Tax=Chromatium okenii TaxID=61644 RepID=UPI001F5B3ED8|nr:c-type cytochrome biogenesis protein CcmI [Chromatium okenii]